MAQKRPLCLYNGSLEELRVADALLPEAVGRDSGVVTIINRGVVSGCTVTKSTTATRKLNISAGVAFANGRTYDVMALDGAADVPSNTGGSAVTLYAYLYPHSSGDYRLAVGDTVPADGFSIYRLTVPAGNTAANDPYLASVTLTDIRRIESDWPVLMNSPPEVSVPLSRTLLSSGYSLSFDAVSWAGAQSIPLLQIFSRANNGFMVRLLSSHDSVSVRWELLA